ncbi:MAG: OsmC family protein [candidate division WS1 bacterium]|jgi:uncharacterized OsmC-like protein|nr:OsmC family protein [candidate division WS1 bacterium]
MILLGNVKLTLNGDYPIHVDIDGIKVDMDAPETLGGGASLPNPTDWFLASVAACKIAYAMGFIKRRGLTVNSITATAEACKSTSQCESIDIKLAIDGDIPEEMRPALDKFISACFVGQTVKNGAKVTFEVTY